MNPATAFGTVLIDELVRHGLRDAVIAPGSRSAPLALALAADERVRLHVRHDERSAAFLALGLARGADHGRRPALVVCTSGTAAANFLPAVAEADLAGVPLLVVTADRPPELRGTGANQTIDQVGLFGPRVRWFSEVGVPEGRDGEAAYWRSVASRAWSEAAGGLGGAPGPVHVNCALREPLVGEDVPRHLGGRPDGAPFTAGLAVHTPPSPQAVDVLAAAIERFERGVIVVGDRAGGAPLGVLAELASRGGWPLLAEAHSGARRGTAAVATYDGLLRTEAFASAHRPDVAVVVGRIGLSRALLAWLDAGVHQIAVVPPGQFADPARSTAQVLPVDPAALAAAVLERLGPTGRGPTDWLRGWREADEAAKAALDAVLDGQDQPTEPRLARDLGAALPDGATLVVGSSMPIRDLDATLGPRDGLRIVANRGASGIDGFVSTAVGVALASAGPTVALTGDLSLIHDGNGLLIPPGDAVPDLTLVVVNNDGGGIFSLLPQAGLAGFERVFGTPHGLDLARLAALYGHGHHTLDRAGDLPALLARAQRTGGVQLIEARTDRARNAALHRRLVEAVTQALATDGPIGQG